MSACKGQALQEPFVQDPVEGFVLPPLGMLPPTCLHRFTSSGHKTTVTNLVRHILLRDSAYFKHRAGTARCDTDVERKGAGVHVRSAGRCG